jgi:hypothetical protein
MRPTYLIGLIVSGVVVACSSAAPSNDGNGNDDGSDAAASNDASADAASAGDGHTADGPDASNVDASLGDGAPADAGNTETGVDSSTTAPVTVSWTYPGLFIDSNEYVFPNYLSRLYLPAPSPVLSMPRQFALACATLTNSAAVAQSVDLNVAWPSFATAATITVSVPTSGTTACLDPVFDYAALSAITALTPSAVQVSASIHNGASLGSAMRPFEIIASDEVEWELQTPLDRHDMHELTAVFVRPNDTSVMTLRTAAERLSEFADGFGVAPDFTHTMTRSATFPGGSWSQDQFYMEAGESVTATLSSVGGGTIAYIVFTDAQFSAWTACSECASAAEVSVAGAASGTMNTFTATTDGWYDIVLFNAGSSSPSTTVSWYRNSTHYDAAYDVAQATFLAIRAANVSYSNVASTDLNGLQEIRSPSVVLAQQAGNCIEGSLLFASVFAEVGFEAQLKNYSCSQGPETALPVSFSGPLYHEIVGVRVPGAKYFWPIETTAVGGTSGTTTPFQAQNGAINTAYAYATYACEDDVSVFVAREANITAGQ